MQFLYVISEIKLFISKGLDFVLLFVLFLSVYKILTETKSIVLVRGFLFIIILYVTSYLLDLKTVNWLLNFIAPSMITGAIVVFQNEFRAVLTKLGSLSLFLGKNPIDTTVIDEILSASKHLAQKKRGALIVFDRNLNLTRIKLGVELDCKISQQILISIFEHDNPLHDGAILIQNSKISYASCILPLSNKEGISQSFGTRHRAAVGISELSDVVVLVISEESQAMSIVYDSNIYYDLDEKEIKEKLFKLLVKKIKAKEIP